MQDVVANIRLKAGLHELRGGFLDRVAERCLEIEAIIATAAIGGLGEEDCRLIAHHAHKTCGVAATFGYAELGERAQAVETMLTGLSGPPDWQEVHPVIEALLDEMENVLDADYGPAELLG
jgi:HPt (histidine-containing phosphotransfer) domain-containing protein